MYIKYYDYTDEFETVEIPDNTEAIIVEVITGDEIVRAIYRDSDGNLDYEEFDSGGRNMDFMDNFYVIDPKNKEEFEKWCNRESAYDW